MDDARFDRLARVLGTRFARRPALTQLAVLAVAGVAAPDDAGAARKKAKPRRCRPACGPCERCADGACKAKGGACPGGSCVDGACVPDAAPGCDPACGGGQACRDGLCSCADGEEFCAGRCRDLGTDEAHCGACDQACPANGRCVDGGCFCRAGETLCRDADACADTETDRAHCGRCGNACGGAERCVGGSCVSTCQDGEKVCGAACVPVGDCCADADCAGDGVCRDGSCECLNGGTVCGDRCRSLDTDEAHCGACDRACPTGARCLEGECFCRAGTTFCRRAGACIDTDADPAHCGACGHACADEETCEGGGCVVACPTDLCGGVCCADGESCVNDACCPYGRNICNEVCCPLHARCVNDACCPSDRYVCHGRDGGVECCPEGHACHGPGDTCALVECPAGTSKCGLWVCKPRRDNGLGQTFVSCYTEPDDGYDYGAAYVASAAWLEAVGGAITARVFSCADGTDAYDTICAYRRNEAGSDHAESVACWSYAGPAMGHVSPPGPGMVCPTTQDPAWG